jgi:hypothetical protein
MFKLKIVRITNQFKFENPLKFEICSLFKICSIFKICSNLKICANWKSVQYSKSFQIRKYVQIRNLFDLKSVQVKTVQNLKRYWPVLVPHERAWLRLILWALLEEVWTLDERVVERNIGPAQESARRTRNGERGTALHRQGLEHDTISRACGNLIKKKL